MAPALLGFTFANPFEKPKARKVNDSSIIAVEGWRIRKKKRWGNWDWKTGASYSNWRRTEGRRRSCWLSWRRRGSAFSPLEKRRSGCAVSSENLKRNLWNKHRLTIRRWLLSRSASNTRNTSFLPPMSSSNAAAECVCMCEYTFFLFYDLNKPDVLMGWVEKTMWLRP